MYTFEAPSDFNAQSSLENTVWLSIVSMLGLFLYKVVSEERKVDSGQNIKVF